MKSELLAPAGGEEAAKASLYAGADAIYLGLSRFSARSSAENFDEAALKKTAEFAHLLGARVHVALNTIVLEEELDAFFDAARRAYNCGADAILVQDLFLGRELKRLYPEMTLHLSTQAGCCNVYGAELAEEFGFSRVVLARETPMKDIEEISKMIETEVFVQGALCTAFSGQCYFSSFAGGNSGNRGRCKQPCRKKYSIDRAGFSSPAYSLSLSDLSVGRRIREFQDAGVTSFKIEGRMRRPAYCAAAVEYYRAILDGTPEKEAFSRLKRAYNRGNYTAGLAFGQDETLISRDVQGHIGECVGTLKIVGGKYFAESGYAAEKGDCFKLLRAGKEVGGAVFSAGGKGGFYLESHDGLKEGEAVCLTTQANMEFRPRRRKLKISAQFRVGMPVRIAACGVEVSGEPPAPARTSPLSKEEIAACLCKTDGLPFDPEAEVETDGVFLPRAQLNALRRGFYEALKAALLPKRLPLEERARVLPMIRPVQGRETACIAGRGDIEIYKPETYRDLARPAAKVVYLYLPPLFTSEDEALISSALRDYDGIYCEGYYGIKLAKRYQIKLFAGVGFNLTNSYGAAGIGEFCDRFTLSKELSVSSQSRLAAKGAFALRAGGIKLMDLSYCPFGKQCGGCDRRRRYTLTDEAGRAFPVIRYEMGRCRFEVYNCADLNARGGLASALIDRTVSAGKTTKGHSERDVT